MGIFDFFKSKSETLNIDLSDYKFVSNDHIRYENGRDVSGHNYDCGRGIRVQNNITGGEGYTVTIYNLDGNHPVWGNNIQMAPKQMKIIEQGADVIKLRGFGYDKMGASFADYGVTLFLTSNEIEKLSLQMYDRNIEIVYFKNEGVKVASGKPQNQMVTEQMKADFSNGVKASGSGDNAKAVFFFNKALGLDTTTGYANDEWQSCCYYNIAAAQKEMGKYNDAISNYKKVLNLDKNIEGAYLGLSQCYYDQDTNEGLQNSVNILDECLKHFPQSHDAYYNKACVFYVRKDMNTALELFKKAKYYGNTEADFYINLLSFGK